MKKHPRYGFTLVELLVVIAILAVLMGVLLPALGRARESASTIKCSANMHSIGQAISVYVTQYKGSLPASNYYKGLSLAGGTQTPSQPVDGYVHWSSFLFGDRDRAGTDAAYKSLQGWDIFQCPSIGGLPPANTFEGNNDSLPNETAGVVDWQAPRLSYTVNEALCPRGIFVKQFSDRGNVRAYHFVKSTAVKEPQHTILVTEIWGLQDAVKAKTLTGSGGDESGNVSATRRPINGFTGGMISPDQLYKVPVNGVIRQAALTDIGKNPEASTSSTPTTLLNWVGRNHGSKKLDGKGFDLRLTNFLYVDGHVEAKSIRDTIKPFEWGERMYTLE